MKAIVNARIIKGNTILEGYTVLFDEKILGIQESSALYELKAAEIFDAAGRYLSPGFIDVHIHGCLGNDTMDDNDSSLVNISKAITATGVTAFLPTTMTMGFPMIERSINRIRMLMDNAPGASILGCHLEGPFISEEYKGAQDGRYIRRPDFKSIEAMSDVIRMVTVAPEAEGAEEFIESCVSHGIIAAIGHTKATYEQAMKAIQKGASHITHTFNAMTPLNHRNPGVVGAAMDSSVVCELIADNIHVNPAVQRILLKVKGVEGIILVTDAMKACLLEDGEYDLGGQRVVVRNEEVRLPAGNLAGSVLTLDKALRNFTANTGIGIIDAIKTVTENPARVLKIHDRKGSIDIGKDADFALFDESFSIYATFVKGKKVYERVVQ